MPQDGRHRHGSIGGAVFLICLGVFFLILELHPNVNIWPIVSRYWPLILIFIGLGKVLDSILAQRDPEFRGGTWFSGVALAILVLVGLFAIAVWSGRTAKYTEVHESKTVELQGAKTVSATIEMPAGTLDLRGGSSRLLDAEFNYNEGTGTPRIDYSVDAGHGLLDVNQEDSSHIHFHTTHDDWSLRFNDDVPLDLKVNLGAGQSNLRFNGVNVTRLDLNMGAGQLDADFTGKRKSDLDAYINGGVGSATIHLPREVGVDIHASGGIGSVSSGGLKHDGDEYTNDAYGKSPVNIRVTIKGGVGEITLVQEP
jgi:hypothetical protein